MTEATERTWMITPKNQPMQTKKSSNADTFAKIMAAQRPNPVQVPQSGRHFVLAGRAPSDLMRFQAAPTPNASMGSTLDLARSMALGTRVSHIAGTEGFINQGLSSQGLGDFVRSHQSKKRRKKSSTSQGLGKLSAQFESGQDGIAAIGYDGTGGTSYGKYQIASKVGTMTDFLKFLDNEAPDVAKRLRSAGPANTGSRHGAMPDMWKTLAAEDPTRFEALQEAFARQSHYEPALASIVKNTGLTENTLSDAMREVIWSTAIQHGPSGASRIFSRADAVSGEASSPDYERNMITNVYKIRAGQFGSSTESVRAAVQNRFKQEKVLALSMLDGHSLA
ncbi:MAG: hypothetical protein IJS54_06980 [Desulfovibrio sp.]|nr:hypothetical protein [Desulfovibrio sp.]